MKKVLLVVGTCRNCEQSNSYKLAVLIKNKFLEINNEEFVVEIVNLSEYNLDYCKGCLKCFMTGKCSLDDDMDLLKKKMLDAVHIMFIAPVYIHNVPGIMKNFMDRCSYWTHIMKLLGKTSSAVAVASSNGMIYVIDYMKKVLELLGTIYIDGISITVDEPPMLHKEKDLDIVLTGFIEELIAGINGEIDLKKIDQQTGHLSYIKSVIRMQKHYTLKLNNGRMTKN